MFNIKKANCKFFLLLIIISGLFLRVKDINKHLLWQDEAESAIYALQILDVGYPNSQFRGETLHENDLTILSNSPKYEYESTNFIGSKYEKNKGWLPYYLIALSFKILGTNTWSARLPAVIISLFTILLVYKLSALFFSKKLGLIASLLYAINYMAVYYETQARYYGLEIFLVLLCLYLYYLYIRTKKKSIVILLSLALAALFHTHIVMAIFVLIFFVIYYLLIFKNLNILKTWPVWIAGLIIIFTFVPWLILVEFWEVSQYAISAGEKKILWFILILLNIFYFLCLKFFFWIFNKKINLKDLFQGQDQYLVLAFLLIIFFYPFLMPVESIVGRAFIALIPIITILGSYSLINIFNNNKSKPQYIVKLSFFIIWFVIISCIPGFHNNPFKDIFFNSDWVKPVAEQLKSNKISEDTLILINYNQFPFMFYSNYRAQIIWPLRCSYLRNYSHDIVFITKKDNFFIHCILGRRDIDSYEQCMESYSEKLNCLQKNKICNTEVVKDILIYYCQPEV